MIKITEDLIMTGMVPILINGQMQYEELTSVIIIKSCQFKIIARI